MEYKFFGWQTADVLAVSEKYKQIKNPRHLYDLLSEIWCADTCAPRMRDGWTKDNMTLGQCSITAFLAQDIFGGNVYGILRPGGNYHCYNVIGDCVFDLTSEQFGTEKLCYEDNPEQFREVHFSKEEKRLRYEYLKAKLEYGLLVDEVRSKYKTPVLGGYYKKGRQDPFYLKWCDECQEINLWTYWQGKKNIKADILLLGQDWATPWENDGNNLIPYVESVLSAGEECSARYIEEIKRASSPTDIMLSELMQSLGDGYDPFKKDNDKLFFTNLCLGYRDHGVTGGLRKSAIKNDVVYIERLISIIEPKLVICLGKDTFDSFVNKTGVAIVGKDKSFYVRLSNGENYAMYHGIPVFGQAHTGSYGIKNRMLYGPEEVQYTKENAKKVLQNDWGYMAKFLKKAGIFKGHVRIYTYLVRKRWCELTEVSLCFLMKKK